MPNDFVVKYDSWLAGGCAVCGAPDREGCAYAHSRCWSALPREQKYTIADACRRNTESVSVFAKDPCPCDDCRLRRLASEPKGKKEGALAEAAERALRFLHALNLHDHTRGEQRELLEVQSALAAALGREPRSDR